MSSKRTEMNDEEMLNGEGASSIVKIVTDPDKIKILVDPMRRKILGTMREGLENEDGTIRKEMTVPEIARKLGVSAPKCYHHLDLLVEHGFVRVAKEEKKKRTSITYYERTSPAFVLASSIDELERKEGKRESPLIMFINDGFMLGLTDNEKDEAQELIDEFTERNHKYIIKAAQQFKGKIPDERMREVLNFVSNQYASQDKRCLEIRKELNNYLKLDLE
ncbi:MAG: winged helix-turn-helix transcriptional regulator [Candidatus Heimdallarchaeota archaeon]|nr:winged helix-turn-helix transcriptional regulator [Candidatus Heimdallarchaeota archaeon]MBY8995785.1 winged helix-turn-helix transcriptional regulator [Candidatus Heimdallarchaeota archaeon]